MNASTTQIQSDHPENYCATCGQFWPVTSLARSCEAKHERETASCP
jgi:hypothetical protein